MNDDVFFIGISIRMAIVLYTSPIIFFLFPLSSFVCFLFARGTLLENVIAIIFSYAISHFHKGTVKFRKTCADTVCHLTEYKISIWIEFLREILYKNIGIIAIQRSNSIFPYKKPKRAVGALHFFTSSERIARVASCIEPYFSLQIHANSCGWLTV